MGCWLACLRNAVAALICSWARGSGEGREPSAAAPASSLAPANSSDRDAAPSAARQGAAEPAHRVGRQRGAERLQQRLQRRLHRHLAVRVHRRSAPGGQLSSGMLRRASGTAGPCVWWPSRPTPRCCTLPYTPWLPCRCPRRSLGHKRLSLAPQQLLWAGRALSLRSTQCAQGVEWRKPGQLWPADCRRRRCHRRRLLTLLLHRCSVQPTPTAATSGASAGVPKPEDALWQHQQRQQRSGRQGGGAGTRPRLSAESWSMAVAGGHASAGWCTGFFCGASSMLCRPCRARSCWRPSSR